MRSPWASVKADCRGFVATSKNLTIGFTYREFDGRVYEVNEEHARPEGT